MFGVAIGGQLPASFSSWRYVLSDVTDAHKTNHNKSTPLGISLSMGERGGRPRLLLVLRQRKRNEFLMDRKSQGGRKTV
jgi:hypothetical protein